MSKNVAFSVPLLLLFAVACGGDDTGPTATPTDLTATSQRPTPSVIETERAGVVPPDSRGKWRTLAPMPTPRTEVAVAVLRDAIYVIGGFEADGTPSAKVEVYDPATDQWSSAADLPEPRHHAAASVFGKLFVAGGFERTFDDPQKSLFQYEDISNTWVTLPSMPNARGGLAIVVASCPKEETFGPCIYAVGGIGSGGENLATVDLLSPSGSWLDAASIPTPRDHLVAATNGELIYAIGGRASGDFGRNLDANEQYDPRTDIWTAKAPLPTARSGIAAAELDGLIYVFGGESPDGTFDTAEAYDPGTDSWETVPPMPTARHGLGAAAVGSTIYVIGGGPEPGLSVSGANEAFTPD